MKEVGAASLRPAPTREPALLGRVFEGLIGLAVVALAGLACLQVALRYLFAMPLTWVEEISVIIVIAMVWLGAGYLWLERGHVAVDLVSANLGPRGRRALAGLADVVMIVAGLGLAYAATKTYEASIGLYVSALEIDANVKLYPVMAGAVLLALAAAVDLWRVVAGRDR